ncbi:MAG: Asp23/Gls24 family envelope stress response protein [Oscillospiraceae bacterium]|jgi:uncharacterized alkaline shock family protein YloU|nr:Asp23/Gls24 family envelope stress response protein [Oscillospiraceae bacterium]
MPENREYVTCAGERGSINISEDVIALIAAGETLAVEGVASLVSSPGKEIIDIIGRKGAPRGVKINIDGKSVAIDVFIMIELGRSVNDTGGAVQRAVKEAVESSVGLEATVVNVHVCGISLKKHKQ